MTRINIRDYIQPKKKSSLRLTFSQEQKDEILEAFTLYDKDGDGLINTKELGTVFRALGQSPTVRDETDIVAHFAHNKQSEIDFITFFKLVTDRYREVDDDNELRESFRRFDKEEKGYVEEKELRTMLTTIGEPLTEEEVDEWLADGKDFIDRGRVFYEDLSTFMLSK